MSDAGLHRSSSGATPPAQTSRNSSRARNDLPEAVSSLEPRATRACLSLRRVSPFAAAATVWTVDVCAD